jgi:hypothetical protein
MKYEFLDHVVVLGWMPVHVVFVAQVVAAVFA